MQLEQVLTTSIDEFKQNMMHFCKNEDLKSLTPVIACRFVSVLKGHLQKLGTAAIQSYFESHDREQSYIEYKGKQYLNKYKGKKEIMTVLGKVNVNRNVYQHARGGKSLAPLDNCYVLSPETGAYKMKIWGGTLLYNPSGIVIFKGVFNNIQDE